MKPGKKLPSLLSAIAPEKFRVYVVFVSRGESKVTVTVLPLSLALIGFSTGGDSVIIFWFLMVTYSSKVNENFAPSTGTAGVSVKLNF